MKCQIKKCEYDAELRLEYRDRDRVDVCSLHAINMISFGECTLVSYINEIEIPAERLDILND